MATDDWTAALERAVRDSSGSHLRQGDAMALREELKHLYKQVVELRAALRDSAYDADPSPDPGHH